MSALNLTDEQLQKYHMATLEQFKKDFGNVDEDQIERIYYETFLIRTDHVVIRAAESLLMAEPSGITEYLEIVKARRAARKRINELEAG